MGKEYWFFGLYPNDTIKSNDLTLEQKNIIEKELGRIDEENLERSWIGVKITDGFKFVRNGLPVEYIDENKPNIAREKLVNQLKERYLKNSIL